MSEPITWRSVSAPNFGASAALLNSGGETLNQGITSLANLATGIADKQKGIEVSNAVAALGKAANDSERGAIFDAQAANLRDQGIDLKDLIAADQARRLALNSDATLKSDLAMNDSTMQTNALERIGLTTKNQSEQKIFDHLGVVQGQEDADAALRIRLGDSSIATNTAQAASANASAEHSRAGTSALADAKTEKERGRNSALAYDKLASDPAMFSLDPATRGLVLDQSKVHDAWVANGGNPLDLIVGRETYKSMLETDEKTTAALLADEREVARAATILGQTVKDSADLRNKSIDSLVATVPTGFFGATEEQNKTIATIRAAAEKTYTDEDGNLSRIPMSEINAAFQSAASGSRLTGDGSRAAFNNPLDEYVKAHSQSKDKLKANGKSRTRNPMAGINN